MNSWAFLLIASLAIVIPIATAVPINGIVLHLDTDVIEAPEFTSQSSTSPAILEEEDDVINPNLRVTCDIGSMSFAGITFNHAPCAAHCLIKGYKGGECKGTICHCRN